MGHGLNEATRVVVAADGAPAAGLGHLSRATGLVAALHDAGVATETVAAGARRPIERDGVEWRPAAGLAVVDLDGAAALVLDGYGLLDEVADVPAAVPVVAFQERLPPHDRAALVISAAADPREAGPHVLAGFEYTCLRPVFWNAPRPDAARDVEHVLVTTGGGDARAGLAAALAGTVREAIPAARIVLVRGPHAADEVPAGVEVLTGPPSLRDALESADVVVTAAGQTLLEAAACGTPSVAFVAVDNQRAQAARLADEGATLLVDDVAHAGAALRELASSPELRVRLAERAQAVVDGRGAARIAVRVAALAATTGRS